MLEKNLYREAALEICIENLKKRVPNIREFDLLVIEYAFDVGFTVGAFDKAPAILQEIALKQLYK